ncbi:MAG: FtsX-like permease family protein [Lachnospiraceae bacterium]|nr:FtsX-like permease family protein [Lachnospiraceae bacterium]
MKILNKVTLASLKKNKVRTVVTIIGIILSTAMFTAVTTSISSLKNYMLETTIVEEGAWEGLLYGIGQDVLGEVMEEEELDRSFGVYEIGYMNLDDIIVNGDTPLEWSDENLPYFQLCSLFGELSSAQDLARFELIEGRMPENENEILLPEKFVNYGKQKLKIGDTISASIGYREFNGTVLTGRDHLVHNRKNTQNQAEGENTGDNAQEDLYTEHLVTDGLTRTYTVVGMYNYSVGNAPVGFTVICGADPAQGEHLSSGKGITSVYFTMKKQKELFNFLDRYKRSALDYDYHSHLLYTNGISRTDSFSTVYWGLGTILCIIIVFGSVALIYNAFSISVNERTKQFGLLASIGATKRQLRQSVLFEACTVSIFGIPLGIGAGILGMSITFYALRYRFVGLVGSATIPFSMHIELWALVIAAVLAFFTVLVSAVIPARRAMRISAIEAIRQNSEIRINRKAVRTRGFLHKLFGMEGTLADKNFHRNRKKYRATVISLFVSIVLFISASSFVDYLKDSTSSVSIADNYDYRYYVYPNRGYTAKEVCDVIAPVLGVAKAFTVKSLYNPTLVEKSLLSDSYLEWDLEAGNYHYESRIAKQSTGRDREVVVTRFYFMQDEEYIDYTREHGLTELGWFSQRRGVLVFDNIRVELTGNRYTKVDVLREKSGVFTGNFYELLYDETKENEQERDQLIEKDEFRLPYTVVDGEVPIGVKGQEFTLVFPISAFAEIKEIAEQELYMSDMVYAVGDGNISEIYDRICKELTANGISNNSFYNIAQRDSFERNMIVIINVFSYGFIVLISLIAAANVFNTVSTNISLRRREIAMLESVGMTKKGLHKMLNYECLLYGIKSLCYGLPAAIFITFVIYRVINEGYVQSFYIPAGNIIVAVLSVFLVVFATMFYSVVKLEKNSLVETLKNENV